MSYCRWSCDNFKSDVYTYAHCDGTWTTHVASSRHNDIDTCPKADLTDLLNNKVTAKEFVEMSKRRSAFLDKAGTAPIGLPHDGETIKDADPAECLATLLRLRETGYHVPDHALDALNEEIVSGDETGEASAVEAMERK